jgi:hypothetical protein
MFAKYLWRLIYLHFLQLVSFFQTERIYIALTSTVQTPFTIKTWEILQITRKAQPRSRHFTGGHHRPPHRQAKPETRRTTPGRRPSATTEAQLHALESPQQSTPWTSHDILNTMNDHRRCHSGVGNGRSIPAMLSSMRTTTRKHKNPRTGTHIPSERGGKRNKSHKPGKGNRTHWRSPLTESERQKPHTTNAGGSNEDATVGEAQGIPNPR